MVNSRQERIMIDDSSTDPSTSSDADFAQAFKDLQKGEKTAAALESQLDGMEAKIERLLAEAEANDRMSAAAVNDGKTNQERTKDENEKR